MNLEQAISLNALQQPAKMVASKTISKKEMARRVHARAAIGGTNYKYISPEAWGNKWLSSKTFTLMEIDIHAAASLNINAVASVHPPKNPNRVEHYMHCSADAIDPIVVDLNKKMQGRSYLGYIPEVIVLDGKHRKQAQLRQGRTTILAWVGCEAEKKLQRLKKVIRTVEASEARRFEKPLDNRPINTAYNLYAATVPSSGMASVTPRQDAGEGGARPSDHVHAGGPGSGRHTGNGVGYHNPRKDFQSYDHFTLNNKTKTWSCNHCKTNAFDNTQDMYQHLKEEHPGTVHAMGGPGGTSLGNGSGSNPARMGTGKIKAELEKLTKIRPNVQGAARVKELTKELKKRMTACGARSSGTITDSDSSQPGWDPDDPQEYAPGTGPGYSDQFGSPNLQSPGSGVGPRVSNKGASRSENRRNLAAKGMTKLPDGSGFFTATIPTKKKKVKSGKHIAKIYEEVEACSCGKIHATAPPGREDQVRELKKKYGEDSSIPFKISWADYHKGKK